MIVAFGIVHIGFSDWLRWSGFVNRVWRFDNGVSELLFGSLAGSKGGMGLVEGCQRRGNDFTKGSFVMR